MKDYKITRPEAAKLIGISLRTLDRYVLKGTIKYKKVKGRVLFSDEDLGNLKVEKNTDVVDEIKTTFDFKKEKKETETFPVFNSSKKEKNIGEMDLVQFTQLTSERDTYKKMYEVLFADLKEKQERLEKVNFKLGEVLAKQELPLLENKRSKEEVSVLNLEIKQNKNFIKELKTEISFQKFIKTIFVILLILTISILTFWYFYNFKV